MFPWRRHPTAYSVLLAEVPPLFTERHGRVLSVLLRRRLVAPAAVSRDVRSVRGRSNFELGYSVSGTRRAFQASD